MCSGVCCGYGAHNSPLDQAEIDAHCKAQADATAAKRLGVTIEEYLAQQGQEATGAAGEPGDAAEAKPTAAREAAALEAAPVGDSGEVLSPEESVTNGSPPPKKERVPAKKKA